jgi:hypothetical protein
MTLAECEETARSVAHSMPQSDFGSTRAIHAFADALRSAILREREACASLVHDGLGADGYGVARLIRNRP